MDCKYIKKIGGEGIKTVTLNSEVNIFNIVACQRKHFFLSF